MSVALWGSFASLVKAFVLTWRDVKTFPAPDFKRDLKGIHFS